LSLESIGSRLKFICPLKEYEMRKAG